jgi:plastocyanin domain-containing protein
MAGTLMGLPAQAVRKVGMTSSHHGPYARGCTRATMDGTMGCHPAKGRESVKAVLSSDWSLQLDSMKLESLVIAYQQRRGEYVPGPCTHRPSSHGSRGHPKSVA